MNMHASVPRQIIVERNKRLMAWMAGVLDLNGEEKRQFYSEMSMLVFNVTDNELAEIICEKLSPKMLLADIDGAKKMINHFYDIAANWHFNTPADRRV